MPTTLEFLQAILPPTGQYCATVIVNKQAKQFFYSSVEELADNVIQFDKRLEGTDGAVYHACASYFEQRRTQGSVERLRAFWLDIDTGPGKPHADLEAAITELKKFVQQYSLPDPILVCSGSGLHVYWPLKVAVEKEQWQPIAQALKSACQQSGLGAGPERTADCASILRPPGSTHRKGSPRPVICGPLSPPSDLEAFDGLVPRHVPDTSSGSRVSLIRNGRKYRSKSGLLADCSNIYAPEAVDFGQLAEGCNQIRTFRDTKGNISEPVWYALLGVLGYTYGGDSKAHEWSNGHPNYSFQETEGKLKRVKELSGPTTCARIKSLNPKGCEGCAFGQSTPLEAGRKTWVPISQYRSEVEAPTAMEDALPDFAVEGHSEWRFKEGGLYYCIQSTKGEPVEVKLSSFPVRVSSVHYGEINRDKHYYVLQHHSPKEGWKDVIVKPSQLYGQGIVGAMADLGVVVHDPIKFQLYLKDSVDRIKQKSKMETSFEQFGWKGDRFLYGERLYGPDGWEPAALAPSLRQRAQWLKPTPGGSLEGWKQAVDNLMGRGSEGMSFTVLASFASVLMPLFDADEGGAVINLMTRHSGAGKTTSLSGARSVWSADPRALELVNIDTRVSKALSLGMLCNLPCLYDEFDTKDPYVVRDFMEMFTSGRDKMRGTSDAAIIQNAASWRMLLIAANNSSIQESIIAYGKSEAPALRVLEFPVESSGTMKPAALMELAKQLNANAGWAGEEFISYLVQPGVKPWVRNKLLSLMDEITAKYDFRKEHRFWVRTLSAIACASIIVKELQLVTFSPERIMKWALDYFSGASATVKAAPVSMIEHLASFLNDKVSETLTMPSEAEGRKLFTPIGDKPKNKVNIRIEVKGSKCYVNTSVIRKWLQDNADGGYKELLRELRMKRLLVADDKLKVLTAGTEIEGGQVRCLVFDIGHPQFTGMMREIKEVQKHEENVRRFTQSRKPV